MSAPTVFLSAATDDLEPLRNVLHGAFSRAGCRVFTQKHSLGSSPGTLREFLVDHIQQSDCVLHLAGEAYGADARGAFPDAPDFQCSWTQFEYYYAHLIGKKVIAFVTAKDLTQPGFVEKGDPAEVARRQALQEAHCERVRSGEFTGTPLEGKERTLNERVSSMEELLQAVASAVISVHGLVTQLDLRASLHQLPPRPQGFVGREADLATLRSQTAGGTVITGLRGMGGIGKTALATVLAHEWAPLFPDAQLLLDGQGTSALAPSGTVLQARVIQAFHPEAKLPDDAATLAALFQQVLTGKRVLLFLDNARDTAQAKALLPPSRCGLLVTSRASILLGTRRPHDVGRLPDGEAMALLREFEPGLAEEHAAELVRLCAGLPLALRLAGAHLALDGDAAGYIRTLGSGPLDGLDKEAADAGEITISETLRLSVDQLSAEEQEAWRALSGFAFSFDERAAEAIANAPASLLSAFCRRSLLERPEPSRYKLHDLAADYARAQLSTEAQEELQLRHAQHYTRIGDEADQLYKAGQPVPGLALFDTERPHIEAAFEWLQSKVVSSFSSSDRGKPEAVRAEAQDYLRQLIALVDAIAYTGQELRFHPRQRITWLEAQAQAARLVGHRAAEGRALGNLGLAHAALGDARKAIGFYEKRLVIAREIGDRRGEGTALGNLGNAHADLGDARKAIKYHEQALVVSREIGDRRGEGQDLGNLGNAHAALGDARKAIEYYEQQLVITREIGDRRGEGAALGNLGIAHRRLGEERKAIEFYEQQLVIVREIGDRRGEGNALWNSADEFYNLGDHAQAITRARAALAIFEAIEDPNAAMVRGVIAEWEAEG